MGVSAGPDIIQDGLVLNLDASDKLSYPGSGTTWKDTSGNGNSGTLTNGPTFNSGNGGAIVFDGTNDYTVNTISPIGFNFNNTNAISGEAWIYYSPSSYDFWFSANNSGIKYRFGSESNGYFYWDMGQHVDRSYSGYVLPSNIWNHVVFTGGLQGGFITTNVYSNNTLIVSQNEGISSLTTIADYYIGTGEAPSVHPFNGRIATIRIYNKVLSQLEITQNYNTTKSRFGLK